MLATNARLRKSEVKTRQWITEVLGGTDIFDPKMPNNIRTKYTDILAFRNVFFNSLNWSSNEILMIFINFYNNQSCQNLF